MLASSAFPGQTAVADRGCSDACEGQEVFGLAFVAAVESADPAEPAHRPFDGSAVSAEPGRGVDALAGYPGHEAAAASH